MGDVGHILYIPFRRCGRTAVQEKRTEGSVVSGEEVGSASLRNVRREAAAGCRCF